MEALWTDWGRLGRFRDDSGTIRGQFELWLSGSEVCLPQKGVRWLPRNLLVCGWTMALGLF